MPVATLKHCRQELANRSVGGEIRIATRIRPKRAGELIGGNLYWILKHRLVAGLEILRFEDREDGRIDIVCSELLVAISPQPKRAHQGWRYLEAKDAPAKEGDPSGIGELPAQLYGRLAALALV